MASAAPSGGGRVAYQGARGAFSHEACLALRPWDTPVPFATFAEALEVAIRLRPQVILQDMLLPDGHVALDQVEAVAVG
ncbi:MAG: hypothetical protein ACK47T_02060, partial [Brevundimonas sp.]